MFLKKVYKPQKSEASTINANLGTVTAPNQFFPLERMNNLMNAIAIIH